MDIPVIYEDDNKVLEVIIVKEKNVLVIKEAEAAKWIINNRTLAIIASLHDMNPFDKIDINWKSYTIEEYNEKFKIIRKKKTIV